MQDHYLDDEVIQHWKLKLYQAIQMCIEVTNHRYLILLALLLVFLGSAQTPTVTLASSSALVGQTSNYTFTVSNFTDLTRVDFTFTEWTTTSTNPFSSSSRLLVSGLTITPTTFPLSLICTLPNTIALSSLQLVLTNIRNPSSTKPYPVTIILYHSSGTSTTLTKNLTISSIANTSFPLIGYSLNIGATSTAAELYLSPQYALHMSNTFLQITYETTMISMSLGSSSIYSIVSTGVGSFLLGSFSGSSLSLLRVTSVSITNPEASITTTINCRFYLLEGGVQYNIQAFYSTNTLTPASFTTLTSSTAFQYGVLTSLDVVSTCPYVQVNGVTPAYTIVAFDNTQIQQSSGSNCATLSSTTCQTTLSGTFSLTSWIPQITNANQTILTITSYTFFQGQFYSLCQSTLTLPISSQILTPTANLASCIATVSSLNTIAISMDVSSVATGDEVYISGFNGVVADANWLPTTISGATWYRYTIAASDLTAVNTVISSVSVNFGYYNPNYTAAANSISTVNIYRSTLIYASSSSSLSLCSTTTPQTITTSSLTSSTLLSYAPSVVRLEMTMHFFDYASGDYLVLNFGGTNNGESYLLGGASYLSLVVSVSVNTITASFININSTAVQITLASGMLPTSASPVLQLSLSNIVNPPFSCDYSISVTSHSQNTGGIKETLTTSVLTVLPSSLASVLPSMQLLANNTFTLTLTNQQRSILGLNSSISSTAMTVTLPSEVTCSSVPTNTISLNWQVGVSTSGSVYSGNTTQIVFSLGTCFINYFSTSPAVTVGQTYNSITSTSTSLPVVNICGDNCQTCVATTCTGCFNSTYTTFNSLYSGTCHDTCPVGSYQSATNLCDSCHGSCGTCSGGTYLDCLTCGSNYVNGSSGYCQSVCGAGKYLSGSSCVACHINCQSCTSSTSCYVCLTNAVLIGSVCQFTTCLGMCQTCEGSQSTCTSCVSSYSLYQSNCYSVCPQGTYQHDVNGMSICSLIDQTNAYIPVTIVGIVGTLILIALRVYSSRKVGNQSRRGKVYSGQENLNYKINILRVAAVFFTYLEIIGAIVVAGKNSTFGLSTPSTGIIAGGLILHLISNVIFLVGYCCIVHKNRIKNEESEEGEGSSVKDTIIMVLSIVFTFRSFKLHYSNLFVDRSQEGRVIDKTAYPNDELNNPMSKITAKSNMPSLPADSAIKKSSSMKKSSILKSSNQKQNQPPTKVAESIPSKKPIQFNSMAQQINQTNLRNTNGPLMSQNEPATVQTLSYKKLTHPFLTYLTFANLLLASVVLIVGCCIQIYQASFDNMLFWGIDALIVIGVAFVLTAWDLWDFTNLKREEQNSQMSSQNAEVNHTHQNLKQAAQVQVQVQNFQKNSPKGSPKMVGKKFRSSFKNRSGDKAPPSTQQKPKLSMSRPPRPELKPKVEQNPKKQEQKQPKEPRSNRDSIGAIKKGSGQRSQASIRQQSKKAQELKRQKKIEEQLYEPQNPPMLKIFEDLDEKDQIFRQTKSKKFNTKNTRYSKKHRQSSSITNTKKFQMGQLFDDLYINFPRYENDGDHSTTYNHRSYNSRSPNRSLQEEGLELEGEFEEMPPNFPDISDIQDSVGPDPAHASVSSAALEPKQEEKEQ